MRPAIARVCAYSLGLLMIVGSITDPLQAAVSVAAPEIDASSLAAGLGLLTAGVLILRSRRRSK